MIVLQNKYFYQPFPAVVAILMTSSFCEVREYLDSFSAEGKIVVFYTIENFGVILGFSLYLYLCFDFSRNFRSSFSISSFL